MNFTCAGREEWLGAWICEDLPFDEGVKAEEHVRGCPECRAEAGSLRELRAWMPPPKPAPLARRRRPLLALALASTAAAALLGFLAGRSSTPELQPLPQPPAPPAVAATPPPPPRSLFSPEVLALLQGGAAALPPEAQNAMRAELEGGK